MGNLCIKKLIIFSFIIFLCAIFPACENPFIQQIWELKTISFDSRGGSPVPEQTLLKGEAVSRPDDPVKTNYLFIRWLNDNGDEWDFISIPTGDVTLFADWIDYGITIPGGDIVFDTVEVGYTPPAPHSVNVTNTTNETFDINVTVNNSNFDVTPLGSLGTFNAGDTQTITVVPKAGLPAGAYSATVTAAGGGYNASFNVRFTVLAATVVKVDCQSPFNTIYIHGDTLDLDGLELYLDYSNGTSVTVPYTDFDAYGISVTISHGTKLIRSVHDGFNVEATYPGFPSPFQAILTVNRAPGAAVSIPEIESYSYNVDDDALTITLKPATLTHASGQDIQYAIETTSIPTPSWQSSSTKTISPISTNTYYLYARSAENNNYEYGTYKTAIVNFYFIGFNENGGTPTPDDQVILSGDKAKEPTPPTRAGFAFGGWFTDDITFANQWNFDTPITDDFNLYAKWIQNPGTVEIILGVDNPKDVEINVSSGITLSRATTPPQTREVKIADADWAKISTVKWEIKGVGAHSHQSVTGIGQSFTIDAGNDFYNFPSTHVLILTYEIGGLEYRVNIEFTITD